MEVSFNSPAAVPSAARPARDDIHSAQDWEDRRAVISQLYATERRPLGDVVEIMAREHGFLAKYATPVTRM